MTKITAGATGALGRISMSNYTSDNLSFMVSKVTAGATGALGRITMTGYTSDNLSSMVEQVTAGATGALGNISMTDDNGSSFDVNDLAGMVSKITAGATGALGNISMTDSDGGTFNASDLTGMMTKITAGATGALGNITSGTFSSSWSIDNAAMTTQIKSGGSGALGNIRMTGYDHDNIPSTYTNAMAGVSQMGGSMQGNALSLSTQVTTLAGTGSQCTSNCDNTTGTLAGFYSPWGITTDGTNLYVVDNTKHRIRKIVISTGAVTTVAGTGSDGAINSADGPPSFYQPRGITTDGTNLYVADSQNFRIRKIVISTGVVTTLAGSSSGYLDHATGTSAEFNKPFDITTDGTNLYVVDTVNNRIRKIVISTGAVTTLAGSGSACASNISTGCDNPTGTSASFNSPYGITTDGTNLYVADTENHRIRKIVISTGAVTTLAGDGSQGLGDHPTGTSATFTFPHGITTDGTNLYVTDTNNHRIRKIVIDNGTVTTLAGSSTGYADNATGTSAQFATPKGITTDGTNLYVVDGGNQRIRKIQ